MLIAIFRYLLYPNSLAGGVFDASCAHVGTKSFRNLSDLHRAVTPNWRYNKDDD